MTQDKRLIKICLVLTLVFAISLMAEVIFIDSILYAQKIIKIRGSSTVQPIVTIAARIFGRRNNIRIKVEGGGSTKGVQSAGDGLVDIGTASRYLHPDEKKKYPFLNVHTIGYDGIAIVVNKQNPINEITSKQIIAIYSGRITNWKELGGPDRPIKLISKEFGRSTFELFVEHFDLEATKKDNLMFYKPKTEKEYSTIGAVVVGQNSEVILEVLKDPGAIGYVSIGAAERAERKLGKIKRISLDGIEASRENVKNKSYPIIRPLSVITKGQPTGEIERFIEFLLSPHGQSIVKNLDYIPLK